VATPQYEEPVYDDEPEYSDGSYDDYDDNDYEEELPPIPDKTNQVLMEAVRRQNQVMQTLAGTLRKEKEDRIENEKDWL